MSYHEALWSLSSVPPPLLYALPIFLAPLVGLGAPSISSPFSIPSPTPANPINQQPRDRDRWHSPTAEGIYSSRSLLSSSCYVDVRGFCSMSSRRTVSCAIQFATICLQTFQTPADNSFSRSHSLHLISADFIIGRTSGHCLPLNL